ncbi:MAG: amidase [Pseudomonadota bacterium]
MNNGFLDTSVRKIIEGYRRKTISPLDVARACIAQVEKWEPKFQALECFDADKLLAQARAIESRLAVGEEIRPLEGIPVGVKDIFNTQDFPTQMGSPLWQGFTPGNDARVVFQLKREGATIPGKTVTAEFAVHTLGKTINPHDATKTPGTSSSGSAVAVATGMFPVALGTQTAGSIVRPASFCGVYGCKPSFGLIPRTGSLKTTDSLDTIGFFVTHFEDIAAMFQALRVHGPNYPISDAALADPLRQEKPATRPWRVAMMKTHVWEHAPLYAQEAFLQWAGKLAADQGVELIEASLPQGLEEAHRVHSTIYDCTLAYYFQEEFKKKELVSPIMNEIIERGQRVTPAQYQQALLRQEELAGAMDAFLQGFDAMISLSTSGEAPPRDVVEKPDPALIWTLTHLPVISAPVFRSPSGLPFGAQLVARRYNDPLLFRFAEYLGRQTHIPAGPNPIFRHEQ